SDCSPPIMPIPITVMRVLFPFYDGANWLNLKRETMKSHKHNRILYFTGGLGFLILGLATFVYAVRDARAAFPWRPLFQQRPCDRCGEASYAGDMGGSWFWMRSPEEEKVVVAGLYNRYCIRCHGVDGRGVWDIPGVPDFTNTRWQASR